MEREIFEIQSSSNSNRIQLKHEKKKWSQWGFESQMPGFNFTQQHFAKATSCANFYAYMLFNIVMYNLFIFGIFETGVAHATPPLCYLRPCFLCMTILVLTKIILALLLPL